MKGKRMSDLVLPDDIDARSKEANDKASEFVKNIVETNNLVNSMQSDDKLAEFLAPLFFPFLNFSFVVNTPVLTFM